MKQLISRRSFLKAAGVTAAAASMAIGAPAASACWLGDKSDVTILYTNDVHTYIDKQSPKLTYAAIADLKQSYQNAGKDVLLVDAGDHVQGTAYGSMDEGASMLGEVALVPKESPINQSGLMFFNTLFDENACCHVAAGRGFSEVIEGFMDMTDEEIYAKGINDSIIHMDFMIGSDDLHIVGIREDGSETDIFVNGTWAE